MNKIKVFLNESPRSVALVSKRCVLLIRDPKYVSNAKLNSTHHHSYRPENKNDNSEKSNKCIVEVIDVDNFDSSQYVELTSVYPGLSCFGVLGIVSVNECTFLVILTSHAQVGSLRPKQTIYKVLDAEFVCLNSSRFDYVFEKYSRAKNGGFHHDMDFNIYPQAHPPSEAGSTDAVHESQKEEVDTPIHNYKKLLRKGNFFFAQNFDITNVAQLRNVNGFDNSDLGLNDNFLWNKHMIEELVQFRNKLNHSVKKRFDDSAFLAFLIRGYAQTVNCGVNVYSDTEHQVVTKQCLVTILSKTSTSGRVFGSSGLDDEGNVCNSVETELVVYNEDYLVSYTINKGNFPIFYELEQQQHLNRKVQLNRSFEVTQEAFKKHFDKLLRTFNEVHSIALVSSHVSLKDLEGEPDSNSEIEIYQHYYRQFKTLVKDAKYKDSMQLSFFKKVNETSMDAIDKSIVNFGCLRYNIGSKTSENNQIGVFKFSSLKLTDKTMMHMEMTILKRAMLFAMKDAYAYVKKGTYETKFSHFNDEFNMHFEKMMESNNETIAKILGKYDLKQKQSSKLLSTKKLFNFSHHYKELIYDLQKKYSVLNTFLGKIDTDYNNNLIAKVLVLDPINGHVNNTLKSLSAHYTSEKEITIFAGTFNVNGHCYEGGLKSWLFPDENFAEPREVYLFDEAYDLIFIGLQEIVELTAGQMMNVDPRNKQFWERKILHEINMCVTGGHYSMLWSSQLGGVMLLLFIKHDQIGFVNNIVESVKKTGMKGISASKGGIAVSMNYSSTSFCFVACHLAAGLNNVEERHENYRDLNQQLRFVSKNKSIRSHENIVWLGDFNYRIQGTNELVRSKVDEKQYAQLFEIDQLNKEMQKGESFPYYQEAEIKFRPTYKFDLREDVYDSSEKMRVPAWCDRILKRGNLEQMTYNACFDIRFSDHRPVYAKFKVRVVVVDEELKKKISNELYLERSARFDGTYMMNLFLAENVNEFLNETRTHMGMPKGFVEEFLTETESNKGLLPPSNDKVKWWLKNGLLARVDLFTNVANIKELNVADPNVIVNPMGEFVYEEGMYINDKRDVNPFVPGVDFVYPEKAKNREDEKHSEKQSEKHNEKHNEKQSEKHNEDQ